MFETRPAYGQGLNSIRIRFTILMGICSAVIASITSVWQQFVPQAEAAGFSTLLGLVLVGSIISSSALTYFMTGRLTRPIESLKASTEAIANGALDTEVRVECSCEVGGLADSFKAMVARVNANVLRIQTLAYEDGITGLPNRVVLERSFALHNMEHGGAVAFIDIDRFKQVNDLFGHQVGDELLRQAAWRLLNKGLSVSSDDLRRRVNSNEKQAGNSEGHLLFRFAGDEFVALINGPMSADNLAEIGDSLINCFSEPFVIHGNRIDATCSVGIARIGQDSVAADELCKFADMAMYEAKKRGRNQFAFFDEHMKIAVHTRNMLERDLPRALSNGELCVHYQPKFCIATKRMAGVEALVRWQHPTRGLLSPGQFLDIAGSKGLMESVGREVFKLSALQAKSWEAMGLDIKIAINVCPSQFLNPAFASNIIEFVKQLNVKPENFELEVTETVAMSDSSVAFEQVGRLRAAGFSIAIDDFGVGYSNLSQLYKLPFDSLKVDRSLTRNIDIDENARRIVAFTIGMAHELGHAVVAEGIERKEQLFVLEKLGCDFAQGYLLGKPMPADQLSELARNDAEAQDFQQVA